jgi:hypothetical protein
MIKRTKLIIINKISLRERPVGHDSPLAPIPLTLSKIYQIERTIRIPLNQVGKKPGPGPRALEYLYCKDTTNKKRAKRKMTAPAQIPVLLLLMIEFIPFHQQIENGGHSGINLNTH